MRRRGFFSATVLAGTLLLLTAPAGAAPRITHGFVTSFDDTKIAYTLFLPDGASRSKPVPVILMTHGWGGERQRDAGGTVGALLEERYAVLTWDSRGFGDSGGEANVDSQEFEVRDTRALIDFVASQREIRKDRRGDPRMGMAGGSYAGGIQLMTASADARIDAIVPEIAWHDLPQSLKPNGVLKLGWGTALYGAGAATASTRGLDSPSGPETGVYSEHIHRGYAEGLALNDWREDTYEWFDARGPEHYIDGPGAMPGVRIPTMIVQGASDTLFNLNQGIANYDAVRANGAPAKLVVFCGGHTLNPAGTSCTPGPELGDRLRALTLAWFDNYVRAPLGDADVGPAVEFQLQDGSFRSTDALPAPAVRAQGEGTVVNQVAPTSGAVLAGTSAPEAMRFEIPTEAGATILGAPRATVTVSGAGAEAYLFFKLVDVDGSGKRVVVDDQVMALKVEDLSLDPRRITLDLAAVSWRMEEGHELLLEISSTSNDHASSRIPSVAQLEVDVRVPVVGVPAEVRGVRLTRAAAGNDGPVLPATGLPARPVTGVAAALGALAVGGFLRPRKARAGIL